MSSSRWSERRTAHTSRAGHGPPGQSRPPGAAAPGVRIEWGDWLRTVERKRRAMARNGSGQKSAGPERVAPPLPPDFFSRATQVSFHLDGLAATEADLVQALAPGAASKACRSRQSQRIRNHVAVLRHVEILLRRGTPLQPDHVVRWYTSISCGLSTASLDDATAQRLSEVVTHVNSPQMRLRPAVEDVAQLHHRLLADPFVPAFNGILSRVLLHYHLSRCGLPTALFDPELDRTPAPDEIALTRRLMQLIAQRYDAMSSS